MYIAFEGVDCVGKSTQIDLLKQEFKSAIFTQEPGGSDLGMHLRELLLNKPFDISKKAEFLLFLADRAEHYEKVLKPNKDKLIISDRSLISGIAYASKEFDQNILLRLNSFALDGCFPDKVIFLKANRELIEERLKKKKTDSIEKFGSHFFIQVQEKIILTLDFLKNETKIKTLMLDASLSIEKLHYKIKEFIND